MFPAINMIRAFYFSSTSLVRWLTSYNFNCYEGSVVYIVSFNPIPGTASRPRVSSIEIHILVMHLYLRLSLTELLLV